MSVIFLIAFVIILGFVTAAIISNGFAIVHGTDGELPISFSGIFSSIFALLVLMVCGPYIVASNGIGFLRSTEERPALIALGCFVVSLFWSFCLGILALQGLFATGWIDTL